MSKYNEAKKRAEKLSKTLKSSAIVMGGIAITFLVMNLMSYFAMKRSERQQMRSGKVESAMDAQFAKVSALIACAIWFGVALKSGLSYKASQVTDAA